MKYWFFSGYYFYRNTIIGELHFILLSAVVLVDVVFVHKQFRYLEKSGDHNDKRGYRAKHE